MSEYLVATRCDIADDRIRIIKLTEDDKKLETSDILDKYGYKESATVYAFINGNPKIEIING